jgi:hypothetical protein
MERVGQEEWLKEDGLRERSPPCGFPVLSLGRAVAGLAARHCACACARACVVSMRRSRAAPGVSPQSSITFQTCL